MTTGLKIQGAFIPRRVFTQARGPDLNELSPIFWQILWDTVRTERGIAAVTFTIHAALVDATHRATLDIFHVRQRTGIVHPKRPLNFLTLRRWLFPRKPVGFG